MGLGPASTDGFGYCFADQRMSGEKGGVCIMPTMYILPTDLRVCPLSLLCDDYLEPQDSHRGPDGGKGRGTGQRLHTHEDPVLTIFAAVMVKDGHDCWPGAQWS